jgi:Ca2+-binding RTX toxin-like protein
MRAATFVGLATALLLAALPAFARGIFGTDGPDTLRGTAHADRISAGAGNDHVYGLGGNDVLIGGPGRDAVEGGAGSDRLVLRDGAGDVARCGAGSDTVVADELDTVWGDCETLREPGPAPPPTRSLVPGPYAGKTAQGEDVSFQVSSGGQLTKLVFAAIHLSCRPSGRALSWPLDLGASTYVVGRDGSFDVDESGTAMIEDSPASYHALVGGHFQSGLASGKVALDVQISGAAPDACTAPQLNWTAAAAILNQP